MFPEGEDAPLSQKYVSFMLLGVFSCLFSAALEQIYSILGNYIFFSNHYSYCIEWLFVILF